MLYFIPAWYQGDKWRENEQAWYTRRMHTEFDDTVKQIQLFHRSGVHPYQILLLSFAPNFRHFLHRQGVYHAPYWSCFDAIQGIRRSKAMLLSFHNLKWPQGIEFIYSNFVLLAMLDGKLYAQVEFGEDGNLIRIDLYRDGVLRRKNIYDDRGFIAATIRYEDGREICQDYLGEDGIWRIRQYAQDGHVEINPKASEYLLRQGEREIYRHYARESYASIQDVLEEVLGAYLELVGQNAIFCPAMHELQIPVLRKVLQNRKKILSFYENRYPSERMAEITDFMDEADYVVVDSEENLHRVLNSAGQLLTKVREISPYDSRIDHSISAQLNVQKILVPVDGIGEEILDEMTRQLGEYLQQNENARVHWFTRQADYNRKEQLLTHTAQVLKQAGLPEKWASDTAKKPVSENELDEEVPAPVKFYVEQCVDELSVSKCIREQRILVDLQKERDIYLQIAAISVGIPQIVCKQTKYVEHGKNGFILQNLSELNRCLEYYLDGMKHWNEAHIYSRELGEQNSTKVLIEEWKEVIEQIG